LANWRLTWIPVTDDAVAEQNYELSDMEFICNDLERSVHEPMARH
jgi:hypothetical protein